MVVINGKRIKHPTCYEELKTRHYQRIITEWQPEEKDLYKKDYFKLFCILTDTDYPSFVKTEENEAAIYKAVRWFIEQPFKFDDKPPIMMQLGYKWLVVPKWLRVPKSTDSLSSGQNILLLQYMEGKVKQQCISYATALMMQPIYDNAPIDSDRVNDLEKIILEMPIAKVYPVGFFLLSHVEQVLRERSKHYSQTKINRIISNVRSLLNWHRLTVSTSGGMHT